LRKVGGAKDETKTGERSCRTLVFLLVFVNFRVKRISRQQNRSVRMNVDPEPALQKIFFHKNWRNQDIDPLLSHPEKTDRLESSGGGGETRAAGFVFGRRSAGIPAFTFYRHN
jgi:hypothetical protein